MLQPFREKEAKRKAYTILVERVFHREDLNQDKVLGKSDMDALEKEISIDIAELKRDLKRLSSTMNDKLTKVTKDINREQPKANSDSQTDFRMDKEDNISIRRNSSRHRKKSILNEASYLANRLSRALSNSNILTNDEKQDEDYSHLSQLSPAKNSKERQSSGKNIHCIRSK